MNKCNTCGKRLWFWNKFNRIYGEGKLIDGNWNILEKVRFCSEKCCFKYKQDFQIDFRNKGKGIKVKSQCLGYTIGALK